MEVQEHLDEAHRLMEIAENNNAPEHRDYGRLLLQRAKVHIDMAATQRMIEDSDEERWVMDEQAGVDPLPSTTHPVVDS